MRKVLYLSFVAGKLVSLGEMGQGSLLILFESNDSGTMYNYIILTSGTILMMTLHVLRIYILSKFGKSLG